MSLRYRGPAPLPSAFKAMLLLHQYGVDRFFVIFQINHIRNGARITCLLNFSLISRAELSNGDVEASSASPEQSPPAVRVEVGSGVSDGEWLCCIRQ
jgi:hypothetical protein